ncbi:MAG: YgeY family selenium metabolism-linked hydrolase [Firmicutes bacterium]|nr:YgeY family selenium metabolism-linked hydrolase [Bacillota bacterium]
MLSATRIDELVRLCRDMIQLPSPSGHEDRLAGLVRETMTALGYDEVVVDRLGNVAGRIAATLPGRTTRGADSGTRGTTVLLEGHMDTVGPGDVSRWTKAPHGAEVEGGKIYGRGASDMKGGLAAMVLAAAYVKRDHPVRQGDIIVAGSVHEECFEGVACSEIARAFEPDCVVIGEASQLDLKRGQRGRAELVLETVGKAAHSSNPQAGLNALSKMVAVLGAIEAGYIPRTHPVLGDAILEPTDIISSPYPGASVIPERCRVTFDRRLLTGETREDVLGGIRRIIGRVHEADPSVSASVGVAVGEDKCYTGESIRAERFAPAWLFDEDHWFVALCLGALRSAGLHPSVSHYSFCTNGSYYAGVAGIPTVGFGPSREDLAHVADEYVEIEQLVGACAGYYAIAGAIVCGGRS